MHALLYVMAVSGRDLKISGLCEPSIAGGLCMCISVVTAVTAGVDITLAVYVSWFCMLSDIVQSLLSSYILQPSMNNADRSATGIST
jgi:hypothetical protein